jgi:hypothetical protein
MKGMVQRLPAWGCSTWPPPKASEEPTRSRPGSLTPGTGASPSYHFLMAATGASPLHYAPDNKEARRLAVSSAERADSFSNATQFKMICRARGNDTAPAAINRPLRGLLLFGRILFHGLAPVANMNATGTRPKPTGLRPTAVGIFGQMLQPCSSDLNHA